MLPDYPKIKEKLLELFQESIEIEVDKDPFLAQIHKQIIHEGNSLAVTSVDGYSNTSEFEELETKFSISHDDLVKLGFKAYLDKIPLVAKELIEKRTSSILKIMDKVTETTGNVVNANHKDLSPELVLDALEKMELNFDELGQPIMPIIVVSPQQMEKMKSEKVNPIKYVLLEQRRKEIIEKKKRQWLDRENNRKLVD